MTIFGELSEHSGCSDLPFGLEDVGIPVLAGLQRQGAVLIMPADLPDWFDQFADPADGTVISTSLVNGDEQTLLGTGAIYPNLTDDSADPITWYLRVPEGGSALLVHSADHDALGIAPGSYQIRQQLSWSYKYGWTSTAEPVGPS